MEPNQMNQRISWNDAEVSTLANSVAIMLVDKTVVSKNLSALLIEAQAVLPEDRRKSDASIYKYVQKNKDTLAKLIDRLASNLPESNDDSRVEISVSPAVVSTVSEVSPVAEVLGSTVEMSGETSTPTAIEVSPRTARAAVVKWTNAELRKVFKEMAAISVARPELDGKYAKLMRLAQVNVMEPDRQKSEKAVSMFTFNHKITIHEQVMNHKYNIDKKATNEATPEDQPLVEAPAVTAAPSAEPTPQAADAIPSLNMDIQLDMAAISVGMNRLTDLVVMGVQNQILEKMNSFLQTLPKIIGPQIEASMTKSMVDEMAKLEPKLASTIKSREAIRDKVLVVGPIAEQQQAIIREMGEVYNFKFVASSENPNMIRNVVNGVKHVVGMVNKMNHKQSDAFGNHPSVHLVTGGTSSVIAKLQELYANS
jgi:hypothetical protein